MVAGGTISIRQPVTRPLEGQLCTLLEQTHVGNGLAISAHNAFVDPWVSPNSKLLSCCSMDHCF